MTIEHLKKEFLTNNIKTFLRINSQNKNEYWTKEHFLIDLPKKWEYSLFLIENKKILGFIIASQKKNSIHIHKFMIDDKFHNKGLGKKLLYALECLNLDNITLKVAPENKNALRFYKNNSFNIVEKKEYITMKKKRKIMGIHQPNYFPWLGFFDKIKKSDQFVFIDNVQYIKNSIINRNKILNDRNEPSWFTIPVKLSKGSKQSINKIPIDFFNQKMIKKQLKRLKAFYINAPYTNTYFSKIESLVLKKHTNLASKNIEILNFFLEILEINTPVTATSKLNIDFGKKSDLVINITKYFSADTYLSGLGAKSYNNNDSFEKNKIALVYQKFIHPIYKQNNNTFISHLSIIDALFFLGKDVKYII